MIVINLFTPKAAAKLKLSLTNRGRFVEQKFTLSYSFRCDQILNCYIYDFDLTLLCYLSWTSKACLLNT